MCREEYKLLEDLGAARVDAKFAQIFLEPETWDALPRVEVFEID